ncbi:hypothetical protein BDV96DRAFT_561308 [Lophiotrema nucula]|uniref:Uncharacterized protein n=1 Tax=Lophiotrema nucula TaxID=690887 RepID=A0A6A5ZUI9_9PLEO|nr:hypothetical protein BDV96DRAFT_561308 [Lophiotrema nucula]
MGTNSLAKVHGEWPQRLLHVESMTSYERKSDNTYNGHKEPRYNILTYTWGRFPGSKHDCSITVAGIDWRIPAVRPDHFTIGEFEHTIKTIGREQDVG